MAQAPDFTPDDHMNPVYCIQCRVHIPLSVSQQNGRLCPDCVQVNHQAQAAADQQRQAAHAQQAAAHQAAQQISAIAIAQAKTLIPLIVVGAILVLLVSGGALWLYHVKIVKPMDAEIARSRMEIRETQDRLQKVAAGLEELTRVVNHNAETANYNNRLR